MSAKSSLRIAGPAGALLLIADILCAAPAQADVVISAAQTQNMSCSADVCTPTAADAVLNVGDLEALLASGNVEVTTTGLGVQADNIHLTAALSWSATNTLRLDAYQSIRAERPVSVNGPGGLSLATNDGGSGGTLSFGPKGRVSFKNLSSALTIDGAAYALVDSIKALAAALAANSSGDYALANDYDASQDGTYSNIPITTYVKGAVQGLGNTISNIRVAEPHGGAQGYASGLFGVIDFGGAVENLGLEALQIKMGRYRRGVPQDAAGLVLTNDGLLFGDHVSGSIIVDASGTVDSSIGGLVSENFNGATIENSYAATRIKVIDGDPGGLASYNANAIVGSYATGTVIAISRSGPYIYAGGLTTGNAGTISNSYATGSVKATGDNPEVGGLVGSNASGYSNSVVTSYSSGTVTHNDGLLGGFIGGDLEGGTSDCYWDTTTSGTDQGTGEGNVAGITGLTNKQLKSGLPAGFDPKIWAEKKGVNHGLPYLIANPPPE